MKQRTVSYYSETQPNHTKLEPNRSILKSTVPESYCCPWLYRKGETHTPSYNHISTLNLPPVQDHMYSHLYWPAKLEWEITFDPKARLKFKGLYNKRHPGR